MLFKLLLLLIGFFLFVPIVIFMVTRYNQSSSERIPKPAVTPKPSLSALDTIVFIPYWDQDNAMRSVYENPQAVDGIGLFWYQLTPEGTVETYSGTREDHRIIEFAHENDIQVFALIANLQDQGQNTEEWDSNRVRRMITNTQRKEKHINDLVNLVVYNNFDGLALDYESLDADLRDDYTQFVQELSNTLHKEDKILEIAIHPKSSDDKNSEFFGAIAQDYQALSKYADKLHFMMYTEHTISSTPGPSSTVALIERVLNYTIGEEQVPPEKIVLGIGLFGTHWVTDNANEQNITGTTADLTYQAIEKIARENQHELVRDQNTQSVMMTFVDQDGFNIIWLNDAESLKRRMEIAREYGVSGVSLWRLGGEDPNIWNVLSENENSK